MHALKRKEVQSHGCSCHFDLFYWFHPIVSTPDPAVENQNKTSKTNFKMVVVGSISPNDLMKRELAFRLGKQMKNYMSAERFY